LGHPAGTASSDAMLVQRLRSGDAEAGDRFVGGHYPHIFHYLLYLTGRREAAEDLTQETFLQAWRRLDTFDDRLALRPLSSSNPVTRGVRHVTYFTARLRDSPVCRPAGKTARSRLMGVTTPRSRAMRDTLYRQTAREAGYSFASRAATAAW